MKTTELKQFTISNTDSCSINSYETDRILFNLAYINDKSKNEIKCCTWLSTCRAYITDALRTIILNKYCENDAHTFRLKDNIGIKLNRFLLGIKYKIKEEHLSYCIRIINYYNEINNFPKFKLMGYSEYKKEIIFFIRIPIIYKSNPHLLSLFTLLLRVLTKCDSVDLEKIKSINDIESYFHENKKSFTDIISPEDRTYIFTNDNYKKFKFIFEDYKKLFYRMGKKTLFPSSIGYAFHNVGGIYSLSTGKTNDKKLNERAKKLFSKNG